MGKQSAGAAIGFSVVVPTYNRRDSLVATLEGLARQSYPRDLYEVVVVSDGSTDATHEYLAEFEKKATYRFRWFAQANAGPAAARNRGIGESKEGVIAFLDDDMEPLPQFLASHARHHAEEDKVAVLGPMSPDPKRRREEPAWIAWEHEKLQDIYRMLSPGGEYHGQAWSHHFYSGNASVRKCWLDAVGGFDETFKRQEDVHLAERMEQECGVHFVFDPEAAGLHRPVRSFKSWLAVPGAYGERDAERLQAGLLAQHYVDELAAKRNLATRILTRATLACPPLLAIARPLLCAGAMGLYRAGVPRPALAALSALYNTTYSQSMARALKAQRASGVADVKTA